MQKIYISILLTFLTIESYGSDKGPRGVEKDINLDSRLFSNYKDYFKGKNSKKLLKYYQLGHKLGKADDPFKAIDYDVTKERARVFVPRNYINSKNPQGWGLYLHVTSSNDAQTGWSWVDALAKHKLIFACPHGAGNNVSGIKRIGLTLDTMATVLKKYKIDKNRIVIGGLSGGGAVATVIATHYPEYFIGAVIHARNIMWENVPIDEILYNKIRPGKPYPKNAMWKREMPYITKNDLKEAKDIPFAFVTGERDFNYAPIIHSRDTWKNYDLVMEIFDVPKMGHTVAKDKVMDKVLNWIFSGKRDDIYKPLRADSI